MRIVYASACAILIGLVLSCPLPAQESAERNTGTLTGRISIDGGKPMKGGTVFFFNEASGPPPSATKYWRVPTDAFPIDINAGFTAVLPEGIYFMGAIERLSGDLLGPPREGDSFFISQDERGRPRKYSVKRNMTVDLGVVSGAKPFKRATLAKKGVTSIEGRVLGEKNTPVEGMLVFAYTSPAMLGRPMFVSERSDREGRYLLRVAGSGTYYLRARLNYGGGPPAVDEVMGVYNAGKPVVVKSGKARKGADITVFRVGM